MKAVIVHEMGKRFECYSMMILHYFQGAPCSPRQSNNRMINTFIIVNITPTCRQEIVWRINLCFLSTSKRPSLSHYLGTYLTEELLTDYCFVRKLPQHSLFLHRQIRQRIVHTLLMIWVEIILHVRDYSFLFVRKKIETWLVSPMSR